MSRPDHRDDVIEVLAGSEAVLLDRVVELTTYMEAYRLVARQALHTLADLTDQIRRLRASHELLLGEYRDLRAQTMRRDVRATA